MIDLLAPIVFALCAVPCVVLRCEVWLVGGKEEAERLGWREGLGPLNSFREREKWGQPLQKVNCSSLIECIQVNRVK